MRPATVIFPTLFAIVAMVTALPVRGQTIPSPYEFVDTKHEVTLFVGQAGANRGVADLGPGGGTFLGARYGIELGGPFALELNTFFLPTDRKIYDPQDTDEPLPALRGTENSLVAVIDGRVRFSLTGARTWNGLAPFLTAGGGLAGDMNRGRSRLEDEPTELRADETFSFGPSFMGLLGGGTRWLPTDHWTVRVEAALHLWRVGTPQAFFAFEDEMEGIQELEWTAAPGLIVGLGYRF